MTAAIEIHGVSFAYGDTLALQDIEFTIDKGEFVGIVGPNGSGKSTLFKLIVGLLPLQVGSIRILGQSVSQGRRHIGYVPQVARFSREFPISVEDAVLLGRLGRTRLLGWASRADREAAARALSETGISELARRQLGTLSGGQIQRALIARALASEPDILMLDEPTSNIDQRAEEDIFELLRRLGQRATIIVISHDVAFISEYVSRVACLNRTLVCHQTEALTGDMIQSLYDRPVHAIDHRH
jgi:zinc transport system ATP-binding protein